MSAGMSVVFTEHLSHLLTANRQHTASLQSNTNTQIDDCEAHTSIHTTNAVHYIIYIYESATQYINRKKMLKIHLNSFVR